MPKRKIQTRKPLQKKEECNDGVIILWILGIALAIFGAVATIGTLRDISDNLSYIRKYSLQTSNQTWDTAYEVKESRKHLSDIEDFLWKAEIERRRGKK